MAKSMSPRSRTSTTAATQSGQTLPQTSIEVENAPSSVPTYYVNNTGVETSVWDVKLRFSETVATDKDRKILRIRELAVVRMSPQHAKVVAGIINTQLEIYEKRFGKIPSPAEGDVLKEEE